MGGKNRHIQARLSPIFSLFWINYRSILGARRLLELISITRCQGVNLLHGLPRIRGVSGRQRPLGAINETQLSRPVPTLGGKIMLGTFTCGSPSAVRAHVCVWACARSCHRGRGRAQGW